MTTTDLPPPLVSTPALAGLNEHAERRALADELHARPYEPLQAPVRLSHLALLSGEGAADAEREQVAVLCARHGVSPPPQGASHFSVDLGPLRLRWERHSEFSSYTFIAEGSFTSPFERPPLEQVPSDWLAALPGQMLVAIHVALLDASQPEPGLEEIARLFDGNTVTGSTLAGGAGIAWSDFRLHADGANRFLVLDRGLRTRQAGRLVRRLLEIQTYAMLALLAFPAARRYSMELVQIEDRLVELVRCITGCEGAVDDREQLEEISAVAAALERIAATNGYRFSAARAYFGIVNQRIDELREERVAGLQTIREFIERRMTPAMRTCESVERRTEVLAERAGRATNLLRTRVDIALEEQNGELLASMDRRARLQLRLQETVEGLSVVVLSYYGVSLLGYLFKASKSAGLPINAELATGISVPIVVAAVLLGVRRIRRMTHTDE